MSDTGFMGRSEDRGYVIELTGIWMLYMGAPMESLPPRYDLGPFTSFLQMRTQGMRRGNDLPELTWARRCVLMTEYLSMPLRGQRVELKRPRVLLGGDMDR